MTNEEWAELNPNYVQKPLRRGVSGIRPPVGGFVRLTRFRGRAAAVALSGMLTMSAPAFGQQPIALHPGQIAYDPPVISAPAHPHPGASSPLFCVLWLEQHRNRLNDPMAPGGSDPITTVSGPSAISGSIGAGDIKCRLSLTHASGMQERGWLSLSGPALTWQASNDNAR
jgi:hypothetical protein